MMIHLQQLRGDKMKNNKGFSLVELIVSFTLTMVVVVILFEIIVTMKNLYVNSVTKTELLNKQNLFTDYIYSDINTLGLNSVYVCGNNCISFSFNDGSTKNLEWSFYSSENVNQALQTLSYGEYKINLISNASFDTTLSVSGSGYNLEGVKICSNQQYFNIYLPIRHTLFKNKDFGINILYVYDLDEVSIDLPISTGC